MTVLLFKAHNKGYTRSDGTYVAPFDDRRQRKVLLHSSSGSMTVDGKVYNAPKGRQIDPDMGIGDAMARYVTGTHGDMDLLVWHGTSAEYLDSILSTGIRPSEKTEGLARKTDHGKTFVAADRKDARSFAYSALKHFPGSDAVVLAIRLPAEAKDKFDYFQNGIESFADILGGVPPEWIIGYQVISLNEDGTYAYHYERLAKSDAVDEGDFYVVTICDNGHVLAKAHNKGYTRKDGTYVAPFDDSRQKKYVWVWKNGVGKKVPAEAANKPVAAQKPKGQADMFGGESSKPKTILGFKPPPKYPAYHPKLNEDGKPHGIMYPSKASAPETWHDPESVATFLPGGKCPPSLNGIPLKKWEDAPKTEAGWNYVEGQDHSIEEPELKVPSGVSAGSGVVVIEPDGRVWLVDPSNQFAGYRSTFPKGHQDKGINLQANAIKECFEESGIKVEITGFLGDFMRTTTMSRYYLARRVAGTPTDCGWESQSVKLAPKEDLLSVLNRENDQDIAKAIEGVKTGHVTEDGVESTEGWKKVGQQQGSNPGGSFEDTHGRQWYVKFPDTQKHAHADDLIKNEILAGKLYQAAGIEVPEAKFVKYKGQLGIASRMMDGLKIDKGKLSAKTPGVADGFAVDAWLANYDVAGLVYDNLLVSPDGRAVRIDAGGSLLYRAQGAPKGDKFGDTVTETETYLNGINPQTLHVFGGITQKQKEASVARVASIDDEAINTLVNRYGPGSKKDRAALADNLIARKHDLLKQFPGAKKFMD
jgi:ADP-ribose pyrophosphatase YjhB (NUDIX family)